MITGAVGRAFLRLREDLRRVEARFSGGLALIVTDLSPAGVADHEDLILSRWQRNGRAEDFI